MNCKTHPGQKATETCSHCGNWLCDDCVVNTQGKIFCRPCLAVLAQGAPEERAAHSSVPPPAAHGGRIMWGLLFLFSFLPGANYMYMGLLKRGLATMSCFFLLIFMVSSTNMPLQLMVIFAIPVVVIASFFDGFNLRRRINAGEEVRDEIGDVLNSILQNKFLCTLILIVIAVTLIVTVLNIAISVISSLFPLLVVGLGVYILVKRNGSKG